jgi:hypothetical protein
MTGTAMNNHGPNGAAPIATTWRSYVAEAPAWGIVAGALAVSFWTQVDTVRAHGFAPWEALIWGTSTDAGTVACLFLAREGAHRGTPTWGAWVLSVACAFMSVQFNVVAGLARGDWLAVEGHVWMPALALGVWWWLLHGRHRRWMLRRAGDHHVDRTGEVDGGGAVSDNHHRRRRAAKLLSDRHAKAYRAWTQARRRDRTMSVKEVVAAARIRGAEDISDRTAGRWLAEWEAGSIGPEAGVS